MYNNPTQTINFISGPTSIGKTTYMTYFFSKNIKETYNCHADHKFLKQLTNKKINFNNINLHLNIQKRLDYPCKRTWQWNKVWDNICDFPAKKQIIILGISYSKWQERLLNRNKPLVSKKDAFFKNKFSFKTSYYEWVEEIIKKNIPYKFVIAEKDFITVDENKFFEELI
tara:strand:+ start:363 stop:872 length:510 start_codon:yes stop_codon:yes gene_type:complete